MASSWLRAHRPRRSPPALMEELIEEILLRLPPEEPACLVRAALVCKAWRSIISGGGFLRRYREFHRAPPLLGYLHHDHANNLPRFVPTSAAAPPFSAMPEFRRGSSFRRVIDCRHGRVLIVDDDDSYDHQPSIISFVVWEPFTGGTKHLTMVPAAHGSSYSYTAAVLCGAGNGGGCDHLNCHGGPFRVVLVEKHILDDEEEHVVVASASTYSSETDAWSAFSTPIVLNYSSLCSMGWRPSLLVGDALYLTFNVCGGATILKYDLLSHGLSMIATLGLPRNALVIEAGDGGPGFLDVLGNYIYLISQQQAADGANGARGWARHRIIELNATLLPEYPSQVIGYVEGTDTIFVTAGAGIFALDLKLRQARNVGETTGGHCNIVPYMAFYTPSI